MLWDWSLFSNFRGVWDWSNTPQHCWRIGWIGWIGKAGPHLPHHASLVAKLGEARSAKREVRRERNTWAAQSSVIASGCWRERHVPSSFSNVQQKLGHFENLKSFWTTHTDLKFSIWLVSNFPNQGSLIRAEHPTSITSTSWCGLGHPTLPTEKGSNKRPWIVDPATATNLCPQNVIIKFDHQTSDNLIINIDHILYRSSMIIWQKKNRCLNKILPGPPVSSKSRPSLGEQLYGAADAETLRKCWRNLAEKHQIFSIFLRPGLGKNDELSHRESYQPSSRMKLGWWYGMTWRCPFSHEATASYHPVVMDENDDWYWKPWWLGDPPF